MTALALLFIAVTFLRADLALRLRLWLRPASGIEVVSRLQHPIVRHVVRFAEFFTGFRITVDPWASPPLPDRFLLVTNHQSMADIPLLMWAFPRHDLRFVAKKELGRFIPYISLSLRTGGHAIISRTGDFRDGAREMARLADLSARGISPAVFPEGTRSRTGRVGRFSSGAVRIILERASLPVLAAAVDGGWRIGKLKGLLVNFGRTRYRIRLLALHPAPRGKRQILETLGKVEQEIRAQMHDWRAGGD
ncbi:MAG: lysophospholipid acyltransferase family protein [Spirochaetes bacterium]|nr:lysophospholipid acyltransferase family protein [Spirochaetota bacterium]